MRSSKTMVASVGRSVRTHAIDTQWTLVGTGPREAHD